MRRLLTIIACGSLLAGCGATPQSNSGSADASFPSVVAATASRQDDGWKIDVTISSPYDSPERYADAWRVLAPDGTELAVRILTHDHANEQPFTRSKSGIEIPADVAMVTIEGRDLINGWGGDTLEVELER
ncbi:MAG: hypothetical protein HKN94_17120 [Acidimicrobiales bacterium]|nr:hypothetical protein [Acidimicrobiales bacterium]RZV48865.1 MAG: hypothetical protein EX269_00215 [Acidimicrobiales bacterium]